MRSYRTVSPITRTLLNTWGEPLAGLLSVALVVIGFQIPMPGRYPARCPVVFGLSSPENLLQILSSDCPTCLFSICHQSIKIIKQFEFPFFHLIFQKFFRIAPFKSSEIIFNFNYITFIQGRIWFLTIQNCLKVIFS